MDALLIEDDDLLEKYNTNTNKGDKVTDFYDKEIPNQDSNYTCLSIMSLDSVLKKMKPVMRKCLNT